jgi:hypothetical protein
MNRCSYGSPKSGYGAWEIETEREKERERKRGALVAHQNRVCCFWWLMVLQLLEGSSIATENRGWGWQLRQEAVPNVTVHLFTCQKKHRPISFIYIKHGMSWSFMTAKMGWPADLLPAGLGILFMSFPFFSIAKAKHWVENSLSAMTMHHGHLLA